MKDNFNSLSNIYRLQMLSVWVSLKFCRLVKGECVSMIHYPITRRQILDSSKVKEFADNNIKFDENSSKLSKWVENTVGKGEIARYEQFLLFPVFSKGLFPGVLKGVIVWEWVKPSKSQYLTCAISKCSLTHYQMTEF